MALPAMGGALLKSFESLTKGADALLNSLTALPNAIAKFVEAFSPAIVEDFGRAVGDFMAVLGSALEPILTAFTDLTRAVADYLLPVMRELRPIVQELAKEFLQRLLPVVQLGVAIFKALLPLIQLVLDVFKGFTPVFVALATVVGTLIETFVQWVSSLFGDNTKEAIKSFQDAMKKVANGLLQLAGYLASVFGSTGFIQNLIKNLEGSGRGSAGGMKAATSPAFQSFLEYGRNVSLAASVASGQKTKITQEQYFEESIKVLKDLLAKPDETRQKILDKIEEAANKIVTAILGKPWEKAKQTSYDWSKKINNAFPGSPIANFAFNAIDQFFNPSGG